MSAVAEPVASRPAVEPSRRVPPVRFWAWIGAAFIALELYVFVRWFANGHAKSTPAGPDEVPLYMKISTISWQALGVVGFLSIVYFVVYRPWRRDGEPSFDGLFFLMLLLMVWQDPLLNYVAPVFTFNSYMLNLGSWASDIPTWISPRGHMYPEPLLGSMLMYPTFIFLPVLLCNKAMGVARRRWQLGPVALGALCLAVIAAVDLVVEVGILIPLGIFAWPGAPHGWTLFEGTRFQYPLHEALFGGLYFSIFAILRFFRDDRGRSFAERGIDQLRVTRRRRTLLRLLALVGIGNVLFLFCVNMPVQVIGLHAGTWPKDIQERSYLSDSICGPRTDYACPGPAIPPPRRNSSHVTPDGRLAPPAEHVPKSGIPRIDRGR